MHNDKPLVLIVDDEMVCVKVIEAMLLASNYETLKAYNGKDALNILGQNPNIDIIILDVIMPEMDGFAVCSSIRKNPTYNDIPVILLTSLTDDESQVNAFKVGAVDFISKPIKEEIVKARIKTHVDLKLNRDNLNLLLSEKQRLIKALEKSFTVSIFTAFFAVLFFVIVFFAAWLIFV